MKTPQNKSVLKRLRKSAGKWVSMPVLWRASGAMAIHSRVSDLRRAGHNIQNRIVNSGDCKKSFYRLTA